MDDLRLLVSGSSPPSIIALTETWLDSSIRDCEVSLPSYQLFRRDRSRHGGGTALFVHTSISVLSVKCHCESELLSVLLNVKQGPLLVGVAYRPPGSDSDFSLLEASIGSLDFMSARHVLIVGDFNVDLVPPLSPSATELTALMEGFCLHQMVSTPTRVTTTSSTLLDLIFCSDPSLVDHLVAASELGNSDHLSLSCTLIFAKPRSRPIKRKVWFYQKADFDALNDALEDSLPPESVLSGGNVNSTWSLFKRAFIDTVNRFVPSKFVSYREKLPPWLTSEVRRILSKRDRARRLAKHTDVASDWSKFRYLRNLAVSAVRDAKRHFFNSITCSGDYNRTFWKGYHSLSTSAPNLPSTLADSSTFASSSLEKAIMFNNFFASCFSPPPSALLPSSPLLCQSSSSAILSSFECDDSDVLEAIAHLKRHTSTGHDEISAAMLKGCSVSISSRLACIFNTSFSTSQVPSDWKISRITPIFKAGDPCSVCNYRPISLLSLLGKLQERILHSAVMNFLSVNNAISPSQFGFRPGSSTQEALISMSQLWHQAMEAGGSTLCLFLDIAKAFDSLPHSMIIDALSNVGIAGSLLNWSVDYLSSRSQFVAIHGFSSPLRHVTSGVPRDPSLAHYCSSLPLMAFSIFPYPLTVT